MLLGTPTAPVITTRSPSLSLQSSSRKLVDNFGLLQSGHSGQQGAGPRYAVPQWRVWNRSTQQKFTGSMAAWRDACMPPAAADKMCPACNATRTYFASV
ncbi:hypothetical protein E2C01_030349 [Portunus trituberculatus]|uniref:Uncharacterized protein n=1 Tax=Portunus trituberculatus TaxID=210409 RepID=A0A5B7EQ75_PORTR|nr:hypothetical protein [Portunus trituberculatus]